MADKKEKELAVEKELTVTEHNALVAKKIAELKAELKELSGSMKTEDVAKSVPLHVCNKISLASSKSAREELEVITKSITAEVAKAAQAIK